MINMAKNYAEINKEINQKAEKMVSCNPDETNDSHVENLKKEIALLVFETYIPKIEANIAFPNNNKDKTNDSKRVAKSSQYDQYGNEIIYFVPVNKPVPQEVCIDSLFFLLGKKKNGQWAFNPEKGNFITALKFRVEKDLLNYYEENQKKSLHNPIKFKSLDQNVNSMDENSELLHDIVKDESTETPEEIVIKKMLDLGSIIKDYKNLYITQSVENARYFEGFFTFDTTKAIKSNDEELGIIACKYNDEFFPLLLVSLLEYLMTGNFTQIKDILNNPLRVGINFDKRGEKVKLLKVFFDVTRQTIGKYLDEYIEFKKAISY